MLPDFSSNTRKGSCPECGQQKTDLASHLRRSRCGRSVSGSALTRIDMGKCQCGRIVKGLKKHLLRCTGAPIPSAVPIPQPGVPIQQPGVPIPPSPPLLADAATTSQTANPLPTPASPDLVVPIPHQPPLASIDPLLDPRLSWINDYDIDDVISKKALDRVPKRLRNDFVAAVDRTASLMTAGKCQPSRDQAMKLILALPTLCIPTGRGTEGSRMSTRKLLQSYPYLTAFDVNAVKRSVSNQTDLPALEVCPDSARARAVKKKLRLGMLSKAAQLLMSDGIADITPDTIAELNKLHPSPATHQPPCPISNNISTAKVNTQGQGTSLEKVVQGLPESSSGPSGWTPSMVKLCFKDSEKFRNFLATVTQLIMADKGVPEKSWLNASWLLPVRKRKGGIRPVAIPEIFLRIAARYALLHIKPNTLLDNCQYGVGTPGGPEPVILAMNDALRHASGPAGFISLDYQNAFNTISRSCIANAVVKHAPRLFGLYRCLYNSESDLIVRGQRGKFEKLKSRTGGRQGDPAFPFFFSLAVKPLVRELAENFAEELVVTDADGVETHTHLIWAYLDDINFIPKEGVTLAEVTRFLSSPEIVEKYGLKLNMDKCWSATPRQMRTEGREVLGSWVGGENTPQCKGGDLTVKACTKLSDRIKTMEHLDFHDRLTLLRLCWFPSLNHLLRTLRPNVGIEGIIAYDSIICNAVYSWINDPIGIPATPRFREILGLPLRLGGLGLFSQTSLKPFASTSSFVASRDFLATRGYIVSDECIRDHSCNLHRTANNLNVKVEDLLSPQLARSKNLQRRSAELMHEKTWENTFRSIEDGTTRLRFLENSSPVARGWLQIFPTNASKLLSNMEVRYALRKIFLSTFPECVSPTQMCASCHQASHPTHHLSCTSTQSHWTFRHNNIRDECARRLREVNCTPTKTEVVVGTRRDHDVRADIVSTVNDQSHNFDISVVSVRPQATMPYPTNLDVKAALAEDAARPPRPPPLFFWDDHSDENPHPQIAYNRKFRELLRDRTLRLLMNSIHKAKIRKYGDLTVRPLIFTSGGATTTTTTGFVDELTLLKDPHDIGEQARFRKEFVGRLSVILTRSSHAMAAQAARTNVL